VSVVISHTRPEGTLAHGTSRGDGTAEHLKAARFRWGRSIDCWYLPNSRDRAARRQEINQLANALRTAGFTVEVTIDETPRAFAEAEAERNNRADDRAERYEDRAVRAAANADARWEASDSITRNIPMGQPILVGHHSEGRHRRVLEKSHNHIRAAIAEQDRAKRFAGRAEASAGYQSGRENLPTTLRRIERLEADLRRIQRALASRPIGPDAAAMAAWRTAREADVVQLADEIAHWKAHVEARKADGVKVWGPDDFTKGDFVKAVGSWHRVVRVNKKSLTVPSVAGGSWTDTLPYDKVQDRRAADMAGGAA
jgi:hypothetical protein